MGVGYDSCKTTYNITNNNKNIKLDLVQVAETSYFSCI